jgi:hypothetical protein
MFGGTGKRMCFGNLFYENDIRPLKLPENDDPTTAAKDILVQIKAGARGIKFL